MKIFLTSLFLLLIINNISAQCWTQISAGDYHTVAIKSDGTLWAWGLNDKGQLGDGTTVNKNVPTQIGTDTDWAIIASFGENNLAIKANGTLWSWGDNNLGQVGDGNYGNGVITNIPTQLGTDTDWVKLAPSRAFALKSNGTLWGWGDNSDGRLGTGDIMPHYTPFQIGSDNDWTDVSAGANQTLALKSNNTLWGWGLNKSGSLAIGAVNNFVLVPTQTGNNTTDWQKIAVGGCCSSKMLKINGTLWAMGANYQGNIGNGGTADLNVPTQIGNDTDWQSVATSFHTEAIKNNSSLWGWGLNSFGQIGDGTFINKNSPIQIVGSNQWTKIQNGIAHTVAITSDNKLFSWGWNNYGQLGDGTFSDKNLPNQIGNDCTLNTLEFNIRSFLKIAPNPFSDICNLKYTATESGVADLSFANILGQTIYNETYLIQTGINENSVDLTNYTAGIYFLTLKTAAGSVTIRLIKESN